MAVMILTCVECNTEEPRFKLSFTKDMPNAEASESLDNLLSVKNEPATIAALAMDGNLTDYLQAAVDKNGVDKEVQTRCMACLYLIGKARKSTRSAFSLRMLLLFSEIKQPIHKCPDLNYNMYKYVGNMRT